METSIRDLRNSMKLVFNAVRRGEEVIVYSHKQAIAKIVPIAPEHTTKEDPSFGMWYDYDETKNVPAFARKLRKGRHHDI